MQTEINGDTARIIPEGSIDLTNAEKLKEEFENLVENEEILQVTIDFKNVEKIDSSGLGKILLFHKIMEEREGSIQLANVDSEYIQKVFEMVNLDEIIDIRK